MIGLGGCFLVCGGLLETRDSTQYTKMIAQRPLQQRMICRHGPCPKQVRVFPELPKAEAKSKWVEKTGLILLLVEGGEGGQKSLRCHWGTRNGTGGETE